jgi:hypothetical protein
MESKEQIALQLAALTFLGVIVLVILAIRHDRKLNNLPDGGESLKRTVETEQEATRQHISAVFDSVKQDTTVTKNRVDQMVSVVKKLGRFFGMNIE